MTRSDELAPATPSRRSATAKTTDAIVSCRLRSPYASATPKAAADAMFEPNVGASRAAR